MWRAAAFILALLVAGCLQPSPAVTSTTGSETPPSTMPSSVQTTPPAPVERVPGFAATDLAVLSVEGRIAESGPAYHASGACGQAAPMLHVARERQEAWFWEGLPVPFGSTVFVVRTDEVDVLPTQSCGAWHRAEGVEGAGRLVVRLARNHTESVAVDRSADAVVVGGTTLSPGTNTTWSIQWTETMAPTTYDRRNGTYTYEGTLTVTHLGVWPSHQVHRCIRYPTMAPCS
jgi:hypothetical protein